MSCFYMLFEKQVVTLSFDMKPLISCPLYMTLYGAPLIIVLLQHLWPPS